MPCPGEDSGPVLLSGTQHWQRLAGATLGSVGLIPVWTLRLGSCLFRERLSIANILSYSFRRWLWVLSSHSEKTLLFPCCSGEGSFTPFHPSFYKSSSVLPHKCLPAHVYSSLPCLSTSTSSSTYFLPFSPQLSSMAQSGSIQADLFLLGSQTPLLSSQWLLRHRCVLHMSLASTYWCFVFVLGPGFCFLAQL